MVSRVSALLWISVFGAILGLACSKPFFGTEFWCELLCEDDDASSSGEDDLDFLNLCSFCGPSRRPTTPKPGPGVPLSIVVGSASMNMSMAPNGGSWVLNFVPNGGSTPAQAPAATAGAGVAAPAAPAAAPAAPAAATAAPPAAATTKAGPATTTAAPPTTKKA